MEDRIRVCKQEVHNCKVAPLSEMPVFSRVARERGKSREDVRRRCEIRQGQKESEQRIRGIKSRLEGDERNVQNSDKHKSRLL